MIKLNVSAANIAVVEKETLTEGRVGLLCQFSFTDEWTGLAKTAVFDGADSRDVILEGDKVAVPAECLSAEGYSLSVGVYGKNSAGDIVIPTVYATVGKIQRSAIPGGKKPAEPTPDVVAQIQQAAANAEALARSVREDADLGKFIGPEGKTGGWYTPEIEQTITSAMVINFTPSEESMPEVPSKGIFLPQGDTGEPGGWYTPAVTQPEVKTLRIAFTPSKEDMPAVETAEVKLPGEGSVVIDDNLTIEGAAADAKATGDAINTLSEESVRYKRILTADDDLNDVTDSGIYVFNTGNVPANAPFANLSNVTVFSADYNAALRYIVQVVQRTGTDSDQYIAIRNRNDNAAGGSWSPWYYPCLTGMRTVTDTVLAYRGTLTASDDLNALTTDGLYLYTDSAVPANAPFAYGGIVIVAGSGSTTSQKTQCFVGYGSEAKRGTAHREMAGGTWFSWRYIPYTSSDVGDLLDGASISYDVVEGKYCHGVNGSIMDNTNFCYYDVDVSNAHGHSIKFTTRSMTTGGWGFYTEDGTPLKLSGRLADSAADYEFTEFVPYGAAKLLVTCGAATKTKFSANFNGVCKKPAYDAAGKRISFVGDSISTFAGYVPTGDGYAAYYSGSNGGVSSVADTWWMRLIAETGMVLCVNNSVSGSCCCSGVRTDRVEASNPARTGGLADSDGNTPDIIIVYMGTNDYLNAAGQGTYDGSGDFPTDTGTFREAYSIMLDAIMTNYPMAKVYCCTLQHTATKSTDKRSIDYTTDGTLKRDWNNMIRELAQLFHCEIIDFESCGINAANIPYYTGDDAVDEDGVSGEGSLGRGLHPNAAGHELLYLEALKHFRRDFAV